MSQIFRIVTECLSDYDEITPLTKTKAELQFTQTDYLIQTQIRCSDE